MKIILFLILVPFSLEAQYVSMAPSITESLYAVGLGHKVIGVSKYCNFPLDAKKKPRVGTPFTPNLERLISLSPERVFIQKTTDALFLDKLKKLKLKVESLSFNTYEDILGSIVKLSKRSKSTQGAQLIKEIKANEALLKSLSLKGRALIVIETKIKHKKLSELMVAGPKTYLGEIINMTGLLPYSTKKDYSYFSLEKLLLNPPDYIFMIKTSDKDRISFLNFLKERELSGIKVVSLSKNHANIPGPRIRFLMRDIYDYFKN